MVEYSKGKVAVGKEIPVIKHSYKDQTITAEDTGLTTVQSAVSEQLIPVAVIDQFGHLQTTAMPINRMLDVALSQVCYANPDSHNKSTYIYRRNDPYIIPIVDDYIKSFAPKLSADLVSLSRQSFAHDGTGQIANLLNIREIRTVMTTSRRFNATASLNRKLHSLIADSGHPIVDSKNSLENTAYLVKAMSTNSSTAYLAIEPEAESKVVNNALAIAVHGNADNETIQKIIDIGTTTATGNEVVAGINGGEIVKKTVPDPVDVANLLASSIPGFFEFQHIFRDEIFAGKRGESTAGTLAFATNLGSARDILERISANHLGNMMQQLLASRMLSSTGKDSDFMASIAETEFFSSISKTAIYSHGLSNNEIRVRARPDDPVAILNLVDAYEDVDFLRNIRDVILGKDWRQGDKSEVIKRLSASQKTAVLWIFGKMKEIQLRSPQHLNEEVNAIDEEIFRHELTEQLFLEGREIPDLQVDRKKTRLKAEEAVKSRTTNLAHIAFSDTEVYATLESLEESANFDAKIHNQLYMFADTITQAVAKHLEKDPNQKETKILRELYLTQIELAITKDVVESIALVYALNKFYLVEGARAFYKLTENKRVFSSNSRDEEINMRDLREFQRSTNPDLNNFSDLQKVFLYGYEHGIDADTVSRFVSHEIDLQPASHYKNLNVFMEMYEGSFDRFAQSQTDRVLKENGIAILD